MNKLKVGIIGLGKITQIKHLHYLFHSEKFKIEAVCDLSSAISEVIREKYNIPHAFCNYQEMLKLPLDAVFVLNHDHFQPIMDSLNAGLHIFTEKPLCWTIQEAKQIEDKITKTGKKMLIGYMKRHIPVVDDLQRELQSGKNIKLVRIHSFASGVKNNLSISSQVVKDKSLKPQERVTNDLILNKLCQGYHFQKDEEAIHFRMLLELGIHNYNIVRNLLGELVSVDYVSFWDTRNGALESDDKENVKKHKMFMGILTFENNVKCIWEIGAFFDTDKPWDDKIEVYTEDMEYTIIFPNPFIRELPVIYERSGLINGIPINSQHVCHYDDAFKLQLDFFYKFIKEDVNSTISYQEGTKDLEQLSEIVRGARHL
ncbi:Gfo/Idh/MocA family protein [Paenibacillus periandrae]|uniref:Gfo/Idh/MocA family protein n=1 Tax=Paenibacillus periandrae TaxID=1761741 RepID=UPI001F089DE4|nr:Gfo/Idh/MocA family oxidoreductase [Paenibacillus periandrae]